MTIIATDGKIVAVDRGTSYGQMIVAQQKWRRMEDGSIIMSCGDGSTAEYLLELYDKGTLFTEWPVTLQGDVETRAVLVRIGLRKGCLEVCMSTPVWRRWKGKMAWGSGSDIALGAMLAGADARRAAKIAAKHNAWCGFGVDVFKV